MGMPFLWERNHEKMCIEPWGSDSLRVRASMGTDIQMHLPAGTPWKDVWTGEVFQGGQTIVAEAPLERLPLYLRE